MHKKLTCNCCKATQTDIDTHLIKACKHIIDHYTLIENQWKKREHKYYCAILIGTIGACQLLGFSAFKLWEKYG